MSAQLRTDHDVSMTQAALEAEADRLEQAAANICEMARRGQPEFVLGSALEAQFVARSVAEIARNLMERGR